LKGKAEIEHTFSCEFDPRKRQWILDNFHGLTHLFGDVQELQTGEAHNYVTGKTARVPAVDIVIAGFVCKSVSTENNERERFANCINEAVGKTGETFDGLMGYVKCYKPAMVICENVEGLVKRNHGCEPVINHVRASFIKTGYAFDHKVLDSRDYLLPQRRRRCWMWAFRDVQHQHKAELAGLDVEAFASSKVRFGMDSLFRCTGTKGVNSARKLNSRQRGVVRAALSKLKPSMRNKDVLVDVAKSDSRAPFCLNATPCIVPNSLPYRVKKKAFLSPQQVCCLQGIWQEDFPALTRYAKDNACLTRDLAGNAFSTTVCMAVTIACLAHAPVPRCSQAKRVATMPADFEHGIPAPSTPPVQVSTVDAWTPPRTKRAGTKLVPSSPKRLKHAKSM